MWTGSLTFALVTIPVRLTAGTEEKGVEFKQVHNADGYRIGYRRLCKGCGEYVEYADVAKGFERDDGTMIMLDDEDFAELPLNTTKTIEVDHFCAASEVNPDYGDKLYYLTPQQGAEHSYALVYEALRKTKKVGIAKVALRGGRERLVIVKPSFEAGVLAMTTLRWPDEVRALPVLDLDPARKDELTFATRLIETMTRPFDPAEHHDGYREAVVGLVEAKSAGVPLAKREEPEAKKEQSLLDALQESLAAQEPAMIGTPAKAVATRRKRKVAS
jgi:DNA end-binding protein Ku